MFIFLYIYLFIFIVFVELWKVLYLIWSWSKVILGHFLFLCVACSWEECIHDSRCIRCYIYTLAQASLFVIGMYFVLLWMLHLESDLSIWTFKMSVFHTHFLLLWWMGWLRVTLCLSVTSKRSRCFILGPQFPFSMFIALFICIPGFLETWIFFSFPHKYCWYDKLR